MDFVGRRGDTHRNRHTSHAAQCGSDGCGAGNGRDCRRVLRRERDATGFDCAHNIVIVDVSRDMRADLVDGHCAGG